MSEFDLVIRGGNVVLADGPAALDVGIMDGVIAEVGPELMGGTEELDAAGLHVLPGAIDVHVHADDPGRTHWEGVTFASAGLAVGGTTIAFDMPLNASPPTVNLAAWELKLAAWTGRSHVDFGLWGGVVPGNAGDLSALAEAGVIGFKAFMCDSGMGDFQAADDVTLLSGMRVAAEHGLPVAVHAENDSLVVAGAAALRRPEAAQDVAAYVASRPVLAEVEAVSRALLLAEEAGCAVHFVHLSSGRAVACVAEARARGVNASSETCPHYLTFTVEDVERIGASAKCAPPIRDAGQREELWREVSAGGIDIIATDHSPSPPELKQGHFSEAWGGISGGQLLWSVLVSEGVVERGVPLNRLAGAVASAPADRFGLPGRGRIAVGQSADLVLFDLACVRVVTESEIRHRHPALSPYIGRRLRGRPVRTLLRGVTVAVDGDLVGPPQGRLVRPGLTVPDVGPVASKAPA